MSKKVRKNTKGKGRKVRLGQIKFNRQDKKVDQVVKELFADLNLTMQVLTVKSEVGVLADLKNVTKKQMNEINLASYEKNLIVQPAGEFWEFILLGGQ